MGDNFAIAPKMLIATRFGLGIEDPAWFEHRLVLLSAITAPSLLSQTDQNFEWILRVDGNLPEWVYGEITEILRPFEGRAHVCLNNQMAFMDIAAKRDLVDPRGCLLVGRIDDDDAWAPHTVNEVRHRVGSWRALGSNVPGYGLTFENGLTWLMYDMIELDQLYRRGVREICKTAIRPYDYAFIGISVYTYAKLEEALASLSVGHAEVANSMKRDGYVVDVITTENPMWLYCRHKQTDSAIDKGGGFDLDYGMADLQEKFGIDARRTQRYISESGRYGYCKVMLKFDKRGRLMREVREVERILTATNMTVDEAARHEERREQLTSELRELSEKVVSRPAEIPERNPDRRSSSPIWLDGGP